MEKQKMLSLLFLSLLSFTGVHVSEAHVQDRKLLKSEVFQSPPFIMKPGSVVNKFYFNIAFPRGHIALKSFDAEVVDELGNSVPLHETYLHHWVVERYYLRRGIVIPTENFLNLLNRSDFVSSRNSGTCNGTLGQYFGLGSETRGTSTWVPDPYGIEVGNPDDVPDGFDEGWLLNVHAIDTRGVEDRLGCTECKCSLYNVSKDEFSRVIPKDYVGGLYCCYDETQCSLREDAKKLSRKLYLRYTVKWLDMTDSIVPVKIYILDVTDTKNASASTEFEHPMHYSCKVEYEVKACVNKAGSECVDTKSTRVAIPVGGDIVYGVSHQHSGGVGSALYGQDGRTLCVSNPTYGKGKEAGNEAGYIIGMSTCYPKPGSIKVIDGEILTVVSNYSNIRGHTGVMGLFYILVATPKGNRLSVTYAAPWNWDVSKSIWLFALVGGIVVVALIINYLRRTPQDHYQTLATK